MDDGNGVIRGSGFRSRSHVERQGLKKGAFSPDNLDAVFRYATTSQPAVVSSSRPKIIPRCFEFLRRTWDGEWGACQEIKQELLLDLEGCISSQGFLGGCGQGIYQGL